MPSSSVRARALEAAREILEETGDAKQVTMRGIARRIGVAAPSLYEHFPSVVAIRECVGRQATDAFFAATRAPIEHGRASRDSLRQFGKQYLRFARDHPQLYRLMFTRMSPIAFPHVGDEAQSLFDQLVALVDQVIGAGAHPLARERTLFAWLELHGIATLPSAHPGFPWPDDMDLLDKVVDRLLTGD